MSDEYDYLFKSIVVGDGGVGKTALTLRFSKDFFTEDYKMTIGVDFHVKTISIETREGPIRAKLQLWDTGGQERFSSIRPMYYRGSLGAVLVFDLTNSSSFDHLPQWIEEVRANVKAEIPLLLVGNKSDLLDQRQVSLEEINTFTRDFNLYYMETSAKTGEGVGDCFYILACLMIGQGVPEQLKANNTVFSPGRIPLGGLEGKQKQPPVTEDFTGYTARSSPKPSYDFEPEPEYDFEAPPVPEPEKIDDYEFAAPPVPERPIKPNVADLPDFEPVDEPKIPIPEPKELKFKMPDEILSQQSSMERKIPDIPSLEGIKNSEEKYKPKAVPFSSSVPVPAPIPDDFKPKTESRKTVDVSKQVTPFTVAKKEEPPKPRSQAMDFTPASQPSPPKSRDAIIFTSNPAESSESLVDYMPDTILSKKEKKKLEKERKRKEKEQEKEQKLQEEKLKKEEKAKLKKEKAESTLESTLMSVKKVKEPATKAPSLFQTLTGRVEDTEDDIKGAFVPFAKTPTKEKKEGSSSLRIIPNVADIEEKKNSFTIITSQTSDFVSEEQKKGELLTCKKCGAQLSADYAFCNKCGSKLN